MLMNGITSGIQCHWIIGPKFSAVKRKESLVWSIVDQKEKHGEIPLGMAMSLSRSNMELDEDPSSCRCIVQHPVPLFECPVWIMWILTLVSIIFAIYGIFQNHIYLMQLPAGLIKSWGNLFIITASTFIAYNLSVLWQAIVLNAFCKKQKLLFGLRFCCVTVEPVVWKLGVPSTAAFIAVTFPACAINHCQSSRVNSGK